MQYVVTVWTSNDGFTIEEFATRAEASGYVADALTWPHFYKVQIVERGKH